ncbi:RNA polymerase sigma factor [Jatrophihabitans endophyticus]|uniref:RNA polymerase sigma factor n=1 Tax=Jatrophihabitans endophyticus TaxID=1206085 RepID=UPI0019DA944D|nr:sigma-70 family RNA polymerase sigma factor [Jatrophihabitans endophyticus]MBE7188435.1 sigma-70 family RNA polymerase sigma factor [Jatrophihabitans endophyticus]
MTDREPPPGGEQVDYEGLYRDQWRPLLRLAQSLVDDPASAEDVVQDAFAALHRHEHRLDAPAAAAGYLRISVLNGARSALRRRRTFRLRSPLLYDVRSAPAADETTMLSAEHEAVRSTLAALPHRQREVLVLRLLADLDDREIAEATGMSPAHVRSAASRGLATLRSGLNRSTPEGRS